VNIHKNIVSARTKGKKLLAVLIDPEKMELENICSFF
jgi:putative glycerol-1-phosphate prenyltransferase